MASMDKYVELIKMLEKLFGTGSVSRTIGTRTNVVRFPKGKQGLNPTKSEFDVEGTYAKNPDLVQTIENSIADRMGDITRMNDQELLTYTSNTRRLLNFKQPPVQNADVVKFGSGEEIKGKGLETLIEKQGTKNPPTTVAGRLESQGKKLEKAKEDLKEITEPKSVIGDIIKDYGDFDKYMQSSQKTGYVRATVRQIMREDIQSGKLKLPKELQDQVMQGIGEPIDIYRKVYGEGALEQIDSLADDLGQFRTEEEAAKFARSKYKIEPKVEPVDESMTYDELGNLIKKGPDEPEEKADGGRIGFADGGNIRRYGSRAYNPITNSSVQVLREGNSYGNEAIDPIIAIINDDGSFTYLDSPTMDPFSGQTYSKEQYLADMSAQAQPGVGSEFTEEGLIKKAQDDASRTQAIYNSYYNEVVTVNPFSGEPVSVQDQLGFTQPQTDIFPQQELPTVSIEQFQPYQSKPIKYGIENLYGGDIIKQLQDKYFSDSGLSGGEGIVSDLRHATAASQLRDKIAEFVSLPISTFNTDYVPGQVAQFIGNVGAQSAGLINEINPFSNPSFIPPIIQYPSASLEDLKANYVGATQVPYGQTPTQTYESLKNQIIPFTPNVQGAEELKSRYNKYLSQAGSGTSDELYKSYRANLDKKADGGRIGFGKGKRVLSDIDKLIEQLNQKTKGKKSMESVNPKTGEVTVPKKPIKRAEEPTGTTVMDAEPETVDERSITKKPVPTAKSYFYDKEEEYNKLLGKHKKAAAAHDQLDNIDVYDKIAADQLGEVMADMEGKNIDRLTDAERRKYSSQARTYLDDFIKIDRTRKAVEKFNQGLELTATDRLYLKFAQPADSLPTTKSFDISDEGTAKALTDFARENDPEGFKKIQKIVDDINNKNTLEEFDITGRKPNADGGIAGLL